MAFSRKISRRSFLQISTLAAAAATFNITAAADAPEEENGLLCKVTALRDTQYGPVQGVDNGTDLVWYGIPYGAAPVGERRWVAPDDPEPWSEPKDCTQVSEAAYQYGSGPIGTEDCLKLDVYTTENAYRWPVFVFIHGGNNQTGNTQGVLGHELVVKNDCVFVSLDYRLGLFGFNCLPALQTGEDDTGNYALLDIAKALEWVHNNIARFGGDPNNITISGFSAGGRDVMAMLISPLFTGAFQQAVVFSGGMTIADEAASASQIAWAVAPLAVEDGLFQTEAAAHEWLLTSGEDVRSWLYSLDSARLCPLMNNANIRMSAFPHLYGDDIVLPKAGFAATRYNSVPLLMLTGSTEFSVFNMFDAYYSSAEMAGYDASTIQAAKNFAARYGSDMYRIFNAECSAETMFEHYDAPIYLCQVEYGSENSRTSLMDIGFGSFHGIFVPMLSTVNDYTVYFDFNIPGYRAMAECFNLYLKNFLHSGDPNGGSTGFFGNLKRLFSNDSSALEPWHEWTPEHKVSMVLDADAANAISACRDVSTSYDAILARMDADTSIPEAVKAGVVRNVLNGRWFSAALDAHYGNPTLWR